MPTYFYEVNPDGWDIQVLIAKVKGYFFDQGLSVDWLSGAFTGGGVGWNANRELTAQERTALDTAMATKDGFRPATAGYTLVDIDDFIQNWKTIEQNSNLKIDFIFYNAARNKIEVWIAGSLNETKKQQVINALKNLITITTY